MDIDSDTDYGSISTKSAVKSASSPKSSFGPGWGDRKRRKDLEGTGQAPQRIKAYLAKKKIIIETQKTQLKVDDQKEKIVRRKNNGLGNSYSEAIFKEAEKK